MPSSDPQLVISASRRTDIPAFHMDWLFFRLREGIVTTHNPRNPKQIRHVELTQDFVECIIFWSKNPAPLLARIDELEKYGIPFGITFTLNAYNTDLEPGLPSVKERIATFQRLAERIGPQKMVWRYDPICLSPRYNREFHLHHFQSLTHQLSNASSRCIVSFLDFYARTIKNTAGLELYDPSTEEKNKLAAELEQIGKSTGLRLESCAEADLCLPPAACISTEWVHAICGKSLRTQKDSGQRPLCNCIKSIDIGTNDTCPHGCFYCYANRTPVTGQKKII